MKPFIRLASTAALAAALVGAFAAPRPGRSVSRRATPTAPTTSCSCRPTTPAGNQVVAYDRADDGTLTLAGTYEPAATAACSTGSVVDHLASQGSLTYDADNALLYAVNAGSNTRLGLLGRRRPAHAAAGRSTRAARSRSA